MLPRQRAFLTTRVQGKYQKHKLPTAHTVGSILYVGAGENSQTSQSPKAREWGRSSHSDNLAIRTSMSIPHLKIQNEKPPKSAIALRTSEAPVISSVRQNKNLEGDGEMAGNCRPIRNWTKPYRRGTLGTNLRSRAHRHRPPFYRRLVILTSGTMCLPDDRSQCRASAGNRHWRNNC